MRRKGGSRTSLQSQLGLQFDERYSILNYQSFWLFWLRTFCYAPRHNIYRYITKTMHLEKSKQLITWDGESTCSWQYPKTRRWKLPCSYMTHSLMENSNSFRIKKYPTDDRHGADRCAPSPVQTISKLIPRYDFLAVATQSSQKNWTLCKDIGILLATETKEFSEAGILRLPPDLSPSFRVLHPLAQWTVSTCS